MVRDIERQQMEYKWIHMAQGLNSLQWNVYKDFKSSYCAVMVMHCKSDDSLLLKQTFHTIEFDLMVLRHDRFAH